MNASLILWPVMAQIFLTLILFFLLAARKASVMKAGLLDRQQAALNNKAWPDDVVKVSNNIANQAEVPILFYVLTLMLFGLDAVNTISLILAWVFVVCRFAHSYIHTHSNDVPLRLRFFLLSAVMVIGLFICTLLALMNHGIAS